MRKDDLSIPILDGEEYSLQEAMDNSVKYKVYYYSHLYVLNRVFDSLKEATEFSLKLPTGAVFEIKRIENES